MDGNDRTLGREGREEFLNDDSKTVKGING